MEDKPGSDPMVVDLSHLAGNGVIYPADLKGSDPDPLATTTKTPPPLPDDTSDDFQVDLGGVDDANVPWSGPPLGSTTDE
jgi:hypothetical protein